MFPAILTCLIAALALCGCARPKPIAATTPIIINIAADGMLAVDGRVCEPAELTARLRAESHRKSAGVTIFSARKTSCSCGNNAIEACEEANLKINRLQPAPSEQARS